MEYRVELVFLHESGAKAKVLESRMPELPIVGSHLVFCGCNYTFTSYSKLYAFIEDKSIVEELQNIDKKINFLKGRKRNEEILSLVEYRDNLLRNSIDCMKYNKVVNVYPVLDVNQCRYIIILAQDLYWYNANITHV